MTSENKKRLEKIKTLVHMTDDERWLIFRLEAEARENERLLAYVDGNDKDAELEAAEKCITELEGLLREYGRHNLGCSGEFPQHKCKCGWDDISDALAQSEQEAK